MVSLQDILKSSEGTGMPSQGGQPSMGKLDMNGASQSPLVGNPFADVIVAAVIKVLDFIRPIFETLSKEGNKILSAIRGLQDVTEDQLKSMVIEYKGT
jgi:hypothetical protein